MNSTWGFKLIRKPNSLTDSLIQINASVWSFGFFAASAARATWNDGDKDYISMLTKSFCGRITPKPNSSLSVITFHLGQSKLISCFASQGKILHPQHGLFLFIKFTRQAIYCCSVGTEKCFNFTNRLSLSPTQTQIDSLRHSQFTIRPKEIDGLL